MFLTRTFFYQILMSDSLEVAGHQRVAWKFFMTTNGELYAMITGTSKLLKSYADSLDSTHQLQLQAKLILVQGWIQYY